MVCRQNEQRNWTHPSTVLRATPNNTLTKMISFGTAVGPLLHHDQSPSSFQWKIWQGRAAELSPTPRRYDRRSQGSGLGASGVSQLRYHVSCYTGPLCLGDHFSQIADCIPRLQFEMVAESAPSAPTKIKEIAAKIQFRSRPSKQNQRKGQNEKFMNFALFCEFWCFSLGEQARFTLNFCSRMPLRKVHELTFLWFGLPGPLLTNVNTLKHRAGKCIHRWQVLLQHPF